MATDTARAVAWWSRGREAWSGEASWLVQAPPWSSGWGTGQSGADAAGVGGYPLKVSMGRGCRGEETGVFGEKGRTGRELRRMEGEWDGKGSGEMEKVRQRERDGGSQREREERKRQEEGQVED